MIDVIELVWWYLKTCIESPRIHLVFNVRGSLLLGNSSDVFVFNDDVIFLVHRLTLSGSRYPCNKNPNCTPYQAGLGGGANDSKETAEHDHSDGDFYTFVD